MVRRLGRAGGLDAEQRGLGLQRRRGAFLNLEARHIAELVEELSGLLARTRVRDVQGLPPRDVLLVLEPQRAHPDGPAVLRLRLSADPDAPRLHLQHGRVQSHPGPVGPFFTRLAEELKGATLARIEQVRGDRLVLLEFRHTPSDERRALLAELLGRHSNLVLLGPGDVVIDLLVGAPSKARRRGTRRLAIGSSWTAPGGAARPPREEAGESLAAVLPEPEVGTPYAHGVRAPLSWRVEVSLGAIAAESQREAARKRLRARVARKLARARSLLRGLERRAQAADAAERVRMDGELLKSALGRVRKGDTSVELEDWFSEGAPPRSIDLDPRRSPQENLQRHFDRYRKLERGRESVARELERARERLTALEALESGACEAGCDAEALDARAVERGLLDPRQEADARRRKPVPPRLPYRSFETAGGTEIRVGRGSRDNDDLTFHHSRGNDLWLHTADCPGSHVVLRLARGHEPDPEEVLDAAHLAIHFSPARDAGRAPVHVARRKQVHKPRGAKPGLVQLSGGRILDVRVQPARLEGLLSARRDRGAEP